MLLIRTENVERSKLLKSISLMLSTPVQLNYFLHTLAFELNEKENKEKKKLQLGIIFKEMKIVFIETISRSKWKLFEW